MDSNGVGRVPRTELLDLSKNDLMNIFCALDPESLAALARTAKKLNELTNDEFLWMERCRPWENVVNLKSWRAQMDSGKALFRLLHFHSKLVGTWSHVGHSLRGRLFYVTRACVEQGIGGLEGWVVAPGLVDIDNIMFIKMLDLTGMPDGSHKVEYVLTGEEDELEVDRASPHIVLPSTQSPNYFVLRSHETSGTERTRNRNGVRLEIARCEGLDVYLRRTPAEEELTNALQDRMETANADETGKFWFRELESWQILYKRLEFGEPTPEQPLTGLWAGYYGSHGWEILTVSYSDDGFIVGTKVTGDQNVPSGEISFKARIDTEETDFLITDSPTSRDFYRNVTKTYKGQGRIAEEDFVDPEWMQGFLLVEESGNFRFTWEDSIISFRRLDMDEDFRNKKPIEY